MPGVVRLVTATRGDAEAFWRQPLGRWWRTLGAMPGVFLELNIHTSDGLPKVYNTALENAQPDDLLVFLHDDVWIDDWFFPVRVREGLERFDVIGVAGNRCRVPGQTAWCYVDSKFTNGDISNFSGMVAHGNVGQATLCIYGSSPSPVALLDGLLLAARVDRLRNAKVQFDPQFPFHFYDMDFCRSCEAGGLTMGTWPIAVTHASGGNFKSPLWRHAYDLYRAKWNEPVT